MEGPHVLRDLGEIRPEDVRRVVAGIAAGNEDGRKAGNVLEERVEGREALRLAFRSKSAGVQTQ
jgi:hypothetical protein